MKPVKSRPGSAEGTKKLLRMSKKDEVKLQKLLDDDPVLRIDPTSALEMVQNLLAQLAGSPNQAKFLVNFEDMVGRPILAPTPLTLQVGKPEILGEWWELRNKKGESYLEYDALNGPFGQGVPHQFTKDDLTCQDVWGVPFLKSHYAVEHGPFKLVHVVRRKKA